MGLEAATYISQLVATNPVGATDPRSQGDDHLRLIKSVLQSTLPALSGAVTATHTELNQLHGGSLTSIDVGSVGTPAYTFALDPDTGIYRRNANTVSFSAGGVLAADIDGSGIRSILGLIRTDGDGTVGAPVFSWTNDSDTGLYRVAGNDFRAAAGGNDVLRLGFSTTSFAQVADGSQGQPALGFINDTDCGMWRPGADIIGFSVNGVRRLSVYTTQIYAGGVPFTPDDGSAGAPGFSFDLDRDTGIYRFATNVLGIAAGGVTSGYFTSTNAQFPDGTVNNPGIVFGNDTTTGLARTATGTMKLSVGGGQAITVDSVSDSGLGKVHIHRNLYIDINSSSSATAGAASALPANPQGYIAVVINGTQRRIPYYQN